MNIFKKIRNRIKKPLLADVNDLRSRGISIGDGCEIYYNVNFGSEPYLVSIGNHVRITNGCNFITHDGGVWVLRELYEINNADLFGKIVVGNNVHIGMNVTIMPGVTIGDNCIVGCGAVVTKNIPSNEIWAGVPAKKIKDLELYYEEHKNDFDYTKNLSLTEKEDYLSKKFYGAKR